MENNGDPPSFQPFEETGDNKQGARRASSHATGPSVISTKTRRICGPSGLASKFFSLLGHIEPDIPPYATAHLEVP